MTLSHEEVVSYLLERELLSTSDVVDGGIVIRDVSSRNRNFKVETRGGPSYLLKQGLGAEAVATVANEAAIYEHLSTREGTLAEVFPRFHGYDGSRGVLVLELVPDAEDLRTLHLRTGSFPSELGAQVGRALGRLHRETQGSYPQTPPPWVLSLHMPDASLFREVSAANIELVKIVQAAAGFGEALDELRGQWSCPSFIHHDVKWDNFLIEPTDPPKLRVIDLEVATAGDPRWDLGSALSLYLSFWLFSIPVTGLEPPAHFPALAAYPLDSMKVALRACWTAYSDEFPQETEILCCTMSYMGARLVQTAFEVSQDATRLTSAAVLHLQLALNILQRPEAAASQLLDLGVGEPET